MVCHLNVFQSWFAVSAAVRVSVQISLLPPVIHLDHAGILHAQIFGHLSARVNKRMADLLICGIRSEPPVTHEFLFPLSRGRSLFSGSICGCSASAKSPLIFTTN